MQLIISLENQFRELSHEIDKCLREMRLKKGKIPMNGV